MYPIKENENGQLYFDFDEEVKEEEDSKEE